MDTNFEKPLGEEENPDSGLTPESAADQPASPADEPQPDKWYTSEQILGDQPLSEVGTPVVPLEPEIITPAAYNPPPAAAPPPKKNNTATIIVVVLLVLICCICLCLGLILSFAWDIVVEIFNGIFNGMIQIQ